MIDAYFSIYTAIEIHKIEYLCIHIRLYNTLLLILTEKMFKIILLSSSCHSIFFFTLPSTCVGNVSVFALDIYLDKVGQSRPIYLYTIGQSESRF